MNGIDVSHWNGTLNWEAIKKDQQAFAFIKATEPPNYMLNGVDPLFRQHAEGAESVGIPWSPYHFWRYWGKGGPEGQIDAFLETVFAHGNPTARYLVVDVEDKAIPRLTLRGRQYLGRSLRHLSKNLPDGYQALIYTAAWYWDGYIGNDDVILEDGERVLFSSYPLWVAHYTYNYNVPPYMPRTGSWKDWTFYQYTDRGRIPDCGDETMDLNYTRLEYIGVQPPPPTLDERVADLERRVATLENKSS